jgi:hypothetical protein
MIGVLERFLLVLLAGVITCAVTYLIYRRSSAIFWGYIAVWPLEAPTFAAVISGAQNIQHFDLFMHAFGIPVIAALLVIADILLIELSLVGFLKPVASLLPKEARKALSLDAAVKKLQRYHVMPRTDKVERVFAAACVAGIVELVVLFAAGAFA